MQNLENIIREFLSDFTNEDGSVVYERFRSPGAVDAKITEFRTLLTTLTPESKYLTKKFDEEKAFKSKDPRLRLRMLAIYCHTALKLIRNGVLQSRNTIIAAPDFSALTGAMPGLDKVLAKRWKEAQICRNSGAYISAIILMGSILEACILSRAAMNTNETFRAKQTPKTRDRQPKPLQEWNLSELLAVATELEWIKAEPTSFNFPLRKYQYLVHPWGEVSANVDMSPENCNESWKVLNNSIEDLFKTLSDFS